MRIGLDLLHVAMESKCTAPFDPRFMTPTSEAKNEGGLNQPEVGATLNPTWAPKVCQLMAFMAGLRAFILHTFGV